jgi:hypothetical protein
MLQDVVSLGAGTVKRNHRNQEIKDRENPWSYRRDEVPFVETSGSSFHYWRGSISFKLHAI